jgi:hypothetical protein
MERYKIKNRRNTWDDTWFETFKINDTILAKINELQSPISQIISNGTYFLCDKLTTSKGNIIYQVYTFNLADKEVKSLKKLTTEIEKLRNIQIAQAVTVDLKIASAEDTKKIIRKVDDFILNSN